jgi:hypothetical protein
MLISNECVSINRMYDIQCETCGDVGFHPSHTGAESRAEHHSQDTGHTCTIEPLEIT